jgi:hypothetical protein
MSRGFHVSGIWCPSWLNQKDVRLLLRNRTVLHTLGYYEEFPGAQCDGSVSHPYRDPALQHEKEVIGIFVPVPSKWSCAKASLCPPRAWSTSLSKLVRARLGQCTHLFDSGSCGTWQIAPPESSEPVSEANVQARQLGIPANRYASGDSHRRASTWQSRCRAGGEWPLLLPLVVAPLWRLPSASAPTWIAQCNDKASVICLARVEPYE